MARPFQWMSFPFAWTTVAGAFTAAVRHRVLPSLAVAAGAVWVYWPVRTHPYFGPDDRLYVVFNSHIHAGITWSTVSWAFRSYYINWIPVSYLSHALDWQMFGINPAGHHLMNVAFHALNAALLFWVLQRATGYRGRSFMVAALFAFHPINVEPVAWIAERKTMLSTTFFLLALGSYKSYARKPTDVRFVIVLGFFILALLAKAQVITFPLLLLLWDYWPLGRMLPKPSGSGDSDNHSAEAEVQPVSRLVMEKLPLFVVAAGDAVMTMLAQDVVRPGSQTHPLSNRLGNAIVGYAHYIGNALWPAWLSPFYPQSGAGLSSWPVLGSLVLLLTITAFVLRFRQHRYLVVGWFWFLIAMVPMIGIVEVGKQAIADRYAYLSFIGLFLMICWGVAEWAQSRRVPALVTATASIAAVLILVLTARRQVDYWRNDLTLWTHALQVSDDNALAEYSVGNALVATGDSAEAMPYFYRALVLDPQDPWSNLQIGRYELHQRDFARASQYFQRVIDSSEHQNEAIAPAYYGMAAAYRARGDFSRSRECKAAGDKAAVRIRAP